MGWKDLFKSKPANAKPDPRLRWFGKLPTYGDYYSSPTDADWAVEFNEWVLKGYELHLGRQRSADAAYTQARCESGAAEQPAPRRDPRLPSAACILRLPKSLFTVFAAFQDYGGDMRGRPFPLCFYVGVPSQFLPGPTADRLLPALRILSDLTKLRDLVVRFVNAPGRFETVFGGREIALAEIESQRRDQSWRQEARSISLAEWFSVAGRCISAGSLEEWLSAMAAWGDAIAQHQGEDFGPTLRFPMVMSLSFEAQAAGWIQWLAQRMDLEQRLCSLLVAKDPGNGTGRMSVIAREVVPDDFLLFTPLASSLAYVDDAATVRAQANPQGVVHAKPAVGGGAGLPANWEQFVDPPVAGRPPGSHGPVSE